MNDAGSQFSCQLDTTKYVQSKAKSKPVRIRTDKYSCFQKKKKRAILVVIADNNQEHLYSRLKVYDLTKNKEVSEYLNF